MTRERGIILASVLAGAIWLFTLLWLHKYGDDAGTTIRTCVLFTVLVILTGGGWLLGKFCKRHEDE